MSGATGARALDLTYLIYPGQVQPLQISQPGQPMHSGVITDIVKAIFAQQPYRLKTLMAPAQRMQRMREQGEVHHWLTYGAEPWLIDGARLSQTPLFDWRHVLITRRDIEVNQWNDLASVHLLLVRGYDYPQLQSYLSEQSDENVRFRISYVASPAHALRMLQKGRGDAYLDIDLRLQYHLRQLNMRANDYVIQSLSHLIPTIQMYLMYDGHLPEEAQHWLEYRLAELAQTGELKRIVDTYR
ncbi:substrate-binding periplasmic protein [Saliniradius amylolyticus]|nr:hypothetical protein [Saliniradius amylolyticus]